MAACRSTEADVPAADDFAAAVLPYLDVVGVVARLLGEEVERVAVVALGDVGYLKPLDAHLPVHPQVEEVEDVLDVTDAVGVPVDVYVAVDHLVRVPQLRGGELDARRLVDGAGAVAHVVHDAPLVDVQQVYRLAVLHPDHRPYRAGIAEGLPAAAADAVVAVGEQAVDVLHPRLDAEILIFGRKPLHLHHQPRQHPGVVVGVERGDAEASVLGVEAGTVEQVVAQHAECQPPHQINVERLGHEVVVPDFVISRHRSCSSMRLLANASYFVPGRP